MCSLWEKFTLQGAIKLLCVLYLCCPQRRLKMQKENKMTEVNVMTEEERLAKENFEVKKRHGISNSQKKDSSAKIIFGDPVLCAQFLDGYVDIPMLKNIKPEDIEDVSNRYVHMFTEERNSDVVKRVHVKDEKGKKLPFYIISLIEHKNKVDYNVSMQILRYMVYIWEEYEKEMEKKQKGISKTKNFRYPPVLPIIFYDGASNWTTSTHLKERIILSDTLLKYIPDFDCILVQLKDYSNAELLKRKNELSIVMLIDKLQSADDFKVLEKDANSAYIQEIVEHSSEYLLEIIEQIVEGLLAKLNIPQAEIDEFARQIKERKMAEWCANFKGYDVQAARAEAQKIGLAEGRAEEKETGIEKMIHSLKKYSLSKDQIITELMEQYNLSKEEAVKKLINNQ